MRGLRFGVKEVNARKRWSYFFEKPELILIGELIRKKIAGGFTDEIFAILSKDEELIQLIVQDLLGKHFPSSLHQAIVEAVDLDILLEEHAEESVSSFRERILQNYDYCCALCGLMIERLELKQYNREVFEKLYEEHRGKSFYDDMVNWMSSEPIIAVVLSGPSGVVEKVRALNGATDPVKAVPGSIRGDYANSMDPDNVVHASDSAESARREIRLFFKDFRL